MMKDIVLTKEMLVALNCNENTDIVTFRRACTKRKDDLLEKFETKDFKRVLMRLTKRFIEMKLKINDAKKPPKKKKMAL